MKIFSCLFLIFVIFISIAFGNEDKINAANVENLKILRKSVNFSYKIGNDFLDLVRGRTPTHEALSHLSDVMNSNEQQKLNRIVPVFMPFIGYIVLLIIGVLFLVLMPIVGFCFCLCRCGGKCGGKVKGMDPRHAICKRYTYAVLLGMISVIMLAGIVLAFINNQLIHDTLTNQSKEINAISQIKNSFEIMQTSLSNISIEISNAEKSSRNNDGLIDKTQFQHVLRSQYFNNLKAEAFTEKFKESLSLITESLSKTTNFLERVKKPNEKLKDFESKLKIYIDNCETTKMNEAVINLFSTCKSDFDELKQLMKNQSKPDLNTGSVLKRIVNEYNTTVLPTANKIFALYNTNVKQEYLEYRMYICIGVCCLLLLIVLFYFLGLCFGQCGERPFEDARICNRGVGANLMMAGVAFAFLFTPSIMFITMLLFTYGGSFQTESCRYLTNSYEDGVKSFDAMFKIFNAGHKQLPKFYIYNNTFDSLINKCPTMSMAMAFNVNKDLLSTEVLKKIAIIANKIKTAKKENLKNSYFENIFEILDGIKAEAQKYNQYSGFDETSYNNIVKLFSSVSSVVQNFKKNPFETKLLAFFDSKVSNNFSSTVTNEVKSILNKVYIGSYDQVKCVGMYNSTKMLIDAVCVTFLWPFNGFWYGIGICLVFTIPAIIFAVKLAGLYRHTEKYSADYEEPDYHSYMGFYTNNADNIPMKKPKSGKSSQKNRNSSFNNKDSLKQTNPQYLPVYPYDSYE